DNEVSVIAMKGAELETFMKRAVEGTSHSGVDFSGMTVEARSEQDGKKRTIVAIRVGDKALDPAAQYKVAMNSFMANGGAAFMDKKEPPARVDESLFIRDVLEQYIVAKKKVTPDAANRFVVKTP